IVYSLDLHTKHGEDLPVHNRVMNPNKHVDAGVECLPHRYYFNVLPAREDKLGKKLGTLLDVFFLGSSQLALVIGHRNILQENNDFFASMLRFAQYPSTSFHRLGIKVQSIR